MFIRWSFTAHSTLWMPQQTVELKWIVQTVHSHTHIQTPFVLLLLFTCWRNLNYRLHFKKHSPAIDFPYKTGVWIWKCLSIHKMQKIGLESVFYCRKVYISCHNLLNLIPQWIPICFFYFIFKCDEEFRRENRVDEIKSTFMTFKSKENYKFDIF